MLILEAPSATVTFGFFCLAFFSSKTVLASCSASPSSFSLESHFDLLEVVAVANSTSMSFSKFKPLKTPLEKR